MALVPYLWWVVLIIMAFGVPARAETRATPAAATAVAPGCAESRRVPAIYDVCTDQMTIFADAMARATAEAKTLTIVFGATWCPSCRALKGLIPGTALNSFETKGGQLGVRTRVVEIAVSTLDGGRVTAVPSGEAVLQLVLADSQPAARMRAVPFLVVVEPRTGRAYARNLDDLEPASGRAWSLEAVASLVAAADAEVRGGARAAPEPGWLERKWRRLQNRL